MIFQFLNFQKTVSYGWSGSLLLFFFYNSAFARGAVGFVTSDFANYRILNLLTAKVLTF
jgi:hypothetical protein